MENNIQLGMSPIKDIICEHFGMNKRNLNDYNRKREVLVPRQIYHYFARKYTNNSLSKIGKPFDHSTVFHSISTIENRIETENEFNFLINEIEYKIKNYFYLNIGDNVTFRSLKTDIIKEILRTDNISSLNLLLTKYSKKTEMKNLKKQFEIDLNNESPINYWDMRYFIGGEMRNVAYFGRYGTALKEFDVNKFNKLFSERLTALLQVNDMDVICENIEL